MIGKAQPTRLFVSNLPRGTTEAELAAHFDASAPVRRVTIMVDSETGRAREFGFVTFFTADGAEKARAELEGAELGGRRLTVKTAIDSRSATTAGEARR